MLNENIDNELINGLINGDPLFFDQLFKKYNERIFLFSYKNIRNKEDAEAVVQEVFLNLWQDRDKLKRIKNLNAWIFVICFNIIRKHFRRLAREHEHLKQYANSILINDNTTVTHIEYYDLLDHVEKIIGQLPPRQKTIFQLSIKLGLSNIQISDKLNISKKTVENQLSSARNYIRKALKDEGILAIVFLWLFLN